ncbi:hypothetical protein ACQ4PT_018051 [Festuca glaucescens]
MEVAISAVAGELVSRLISFLLKYHSSLRHEQSEEKKLVERLQQLLMRAGTIVEEADVWYITNPGMLVQLMMLSEAMYRGHRVHDTLRYQSALQGSTGFDEHNDPADDSAPAVLPIIGGAAVGKKTLVAHACRDERVMMTGESFIHLF